MRAEIVISAKDVLQPKSMYSEQSTSCLLLSDEESEIILTK